MINEARNKGRKVHFASLVDLCHPKNSELEPQHQKYKGRVVLRGDIVKDDSGAYGVFTEQGSSASQMTAAKVMDRKSRLPACSGQAADAASAYTQVKMEDASMFFKNPKSGCPDIWIRLPKHEWPKSWSSMEDPVFPLEYGHLLAGLSWERQFEKVLFGTRLGKVFLNWECLFVNRAKELFLSVYVSKRVNCNSNWSEVRIKHEFLAKTEESESMPPTLNRCITRCRHHCREFSNIRAINHNQAQIRLSHLRYD